MYIHTYHHHFIDHIKINKILKNYFVTQVMPHI